MNAFTGRFSATDICFSPKTSIVIFVLGENANENSNILWLNANDANEIWQKKSEKNVDSKHAHHAFIFGETFFKWTDIWCGRFIAVQMQYGHFLEDRRIYDCIHFSAASLYIVNKDL